MDQTLILKIVLVLIMVALTMIFGLLPVKVLKLLRKRAANATEEQHRWPSLILCLLTCFSGGVFLGTCFLHLLPEVSDHFRQMKEDFNWDISYPIAELLSCFGFFLVFFLEELVLLFFHSHRHSHGGPVDQENDDEKSPAFLNGSNGKSHNHKENKISNGEKLNDSTPSNADRGPLLNSVDTSRKHVTTDGINNHRTQIRNCSGLPHRSFDTTNGRSCSPENSKRCRCKSVGLPANQVVHEPDCQMVRPRSCDILTLSDEEDRKGEQLYLCDDSRCSGVGYGSLSSVKFDNYHRLSTGPHIHDSDGCVSIELAEPERCELEICGGQDENPPILMASRPHAHSHGVRSITFLLALSFHSVIEGLALGVQSQTERIAVLFIAVMIHKSVVSFSVGLQLARTHVHQLRWVFLGVIVLALMTPLGASIGMTVEASGNINENAKLIVVMIFEGIGVGTFLYVTFFEILIHERDNEHPNLLKLAAIVVGFAVIGALRIYESHEHLHTRDHTHDDHHQQH